MSLTDEQIIKALECCAGDDGCDVCPMYKPSSECITELQEQALDLINRQKAEIERLESDCKTLSAVLSKDVDHDKELISTFVGFLEEHARDWIFQRPYAGYEYTLKYVYIEEDVKRLEKEFWEGNNNDEN